MENYINLNTVILANEKGFDGICIQSELQKWLRDKHFIHIIISVNGDNEGDEPIKWYYNINNRYDNSLHDDAFWVSNDESFDSYENALEEALMEALDYV